MGFMIAAIGAVIGIVGVVGLAMPNRMLTWIDDFKSSPGKIYGWAAVRVLIGVILILGASGSAFPTLIRVIGIVVILKAALVPLIGHDRARWILDWFQARPPRLVRFLFLLVASFGAFLVWAVLQP